mmetsp:Transcript_226/g.361  ORF Transcript_226/g.361 Transcript_226/m.361 type:complete len:373 (+) Transcript_226:164-1282(+)|eukprot:CAMPEP_0176488864 /NCGR_PEP_ID=MMETSP0200_2-20121128/6955_1 /TAXON_ID=947934 /ORGANISM="Chaetoceros sp., Strain GSL56" /LENGTH=372 /DNA_ID=CAMNT_0017885913 /DNA_START=136 /DNA_END=1254 /DNA_ORIENTATION=-
MKFFKRNRKEVTPSDETEQLASARTSAAAAAATNSSRNPPSFASPLKSNSTATTTEIYDIENIQKNPNSNVQVDEDYNLYIDGEPVYIVKQKKGYLSILFSLAQTVILIGMMIQCSVAPMRINPMIGPYPDALSYWGAKNSYDILYDHEYWRLFTPILLHAGIFHLVCNIAVQLDTGAFFEREWGSFIWLLVYLGSAAAGSILSVIVSPNTIGVGSSGSVCGLFGAKIAEAICRCRESTKTDAKELSHAILCEQFASTLCSVILILVFSFIPYVDWAAHVGGLLGGFLMGIMIFSLQIKTKRWKIGMFAVGLLASVIFYGLGIHQMFNDAKNNVAQEMSDVCGYYQQFFEGYECRCMLERHEQNGNNAGGGN